MQVNEMVELTRQITSMFDERVPRTWGIEAMVTELAGEVGSLSDEILIQEGYRITGTPNRLRLEDEIVDVMFMLIRIADYYGIDLETSYVAMIDATRAKLERIAKEKGQQVAP